MAAPTFPRLIRWLTGIGTATVAVVIAVPMAAETITVDIGDSSMDDDGFCSLREAVSNANSDSQLFSSPNECVAGMGADTIVLSLDVTLDVVDNTTDGNGSNGLPALTSTIVIEGDGHTISRDGGAAPFRFFYLNDLSSDLTLKDTTLSNGAADVEFGGAISQLIGEVAIEECTFSGNSADGGGALYWASGTLLVNRSTFADNQASSGGAVRIDISFPPIPVFINSVFRGNEAIVDGGGIWSNNGASVANSTFVANTAGDRGGAIFWPNQRFPTFDSVTISGNSANTGGGVYLFTPFLGTTIHNSIISGNTATTSGNDCGGHSFSFIEASNNVFGTLGDDGGCTGFSGTSTGNVVATGALGTILEVDGMELPLLADNGGPTQTLALVPDSPAIGIGDATLLPDESSLDVDGDLDGNVDDPIDYDQRSDGSLWPRSVGPPDAGGYEMPPLFFDGFESGDTMAWSATVGLF